MILQELYVAANGLKELPAEIGRMTTLEILDITSNELTHLPDELGNCTKLTELEAAHNRLVAIPATLGSLVNLVEFDLSANLLADLPPELGRLTTLRHLKLAYNRLQRVPRELADLVPPPNLRHVRTEEGIYPSGDATGGSLGSLVWCSTEGNDELNDVPESIAAITDREFRTHPSAKASPLISPFISPASPSLRPRDSARARKADSNRSSASEEGERGSKFIAEVTSVTWAEMRGLRPTMEDTVYVNQSLRTACGDAQLFAIFDGHRASDAAEIAVRPCRSKAHNNHVLTLGFLCRLGTSVKCSSRLCD